MVQINRQHLERRIIGELGHNSVDYINFAMQAIDLLEGYELPEEVEVSLDSGDITYFVNIDTKVSQQGSLTVGMQINRPRIEVLDELGNLKAGLYTNHRWANNALEELEYTLRHDSTVRLGVSSPEDGWSHTVHDDRTVIYKDVVLGLGDDMRNYSQRGYVPENQLQEVLVNMAKFEALR